MVSALVSLFVTMGTLFYLSAGIPVSTVERGQLVDAGAMVFLCLLLLFLIGIGLYRFINWLKDNWIEAVDRVSGNNMKDTE